MVQPRLCEAAVGTSQAILSRPRARSPSMPRRLPLLLILALPSALAAQARPAPPTLVRTEAGSCARCTMTLSYVATVGSANDKELINDSGTLLALPSGQLKPKENWFSMKVPIKAAPPPTKRGVT